MNSRFFFTTSGSAGGVTWKPCASSAPACLSYKRRLSRTILAAVLLAFGVLRLAAQTFTPVLEPPFTIEYPDPLSAAWGAHSQPYLAVVKYADGKSGTVRAWFEDPPRGPNFHGPGGEVIFEPRAGFVSSVSAGDVNGDGNADAVFGITTGTTTAGGLGYGMLFLGDGRGKFVLQPKFLMSGYLQLADVNGDGKDDLICRGTLLLSNGTGVFGNCGFGTPGAMPFPIDNLPDNKPPQFKVLDFDKDGIKDIVGYRPNVRDLAFYKGDGSGGFVFNTTLLPPGPPFDVVDFNGDGKLDIVRGGNGDIEIWLADEITRFSPAPGSPFLAGASHNQSAHLMLGDFNADGKIDIMVSSDVEENLTLLVGNGTGKFTPALQRIPLKSSPAGCWAGDFDGNGATDAICISGVPPDGRDPQGNPITARNVTYYPRPIRVYGHRPIGVNPKSFTLNRRAGYGVTPAVTVAISPPISKSVFSATSPQPWLKLNPIADATGKVTSVAVSADAGSLAAGRYRGSVLVEAAGYIGTTFEVDFNITNPAGTLRPTTVITGNQAALLKAGDFNNDGLVDLVVVNDKGTVELLLGDGADGYDRVSPFFRTNGLVWAGGRLTGIPVAMAVGDFDRDGNLDVAVAFRDHRRFEPFGNVELLLGDGTGRTFNVSLREGGRNVTGCSPAAMATADFNGDGRSDIAVQNPAGIYEASADRNWKDWAPYFVFPHPGFGFDQMGREVYQYCAFETLHSYRPDYLVDGTPVTHASVAVGDIDGDGRMDLVTTGGASGVKVLMGKGDGHFWDPDNFPLFRPLASFNERINVFNDAILADLNEDGKPDLVIASGGSVSVRLNVGGSFGEYREYVTGAFQRLAAGDFNGDGYLDIAAANTSGVRILLGNGAGGITPAAGTFAPGILGWGNGGRSSLSSAHPLPDRGDFLAAADFNGDGRTDLAVLSADGNVTYLLGVSSDQAEAPPSSSGDAVSSGVGDASPFSSAGLAQEQKLVSPNRKYEARMQSDGNFVIYAEGSAIWSTQTQYRERAPYRLAVQSDGNLVIYGSSDKDVSLGGFGVCRAGSVCIATWSTGPRGGSAPYTLKMQDDGNLVLYDSTSRAVWFTGTQR